MYFVGPQPQKGQTPQKEKNDTQRMDNNCHTCRNAASFKLENKEKTYKNIPGAFWAGGSLRAKASAAVTWGCVLGQRSVALADTPKLSGP